MLDDPTVAAAIEAANTAESKGLHSERAAAATAALNAWAAAVHKPPSATPTNAAEAARRLEHLNNSPEWRSRVMAQDSATMQEFQNLNRMLAEADPVGRALSGATRTSFEAETGSVNEASLNDQVAWVREARAMGMNDENIAAILQPRTGTPQQIADAKRALDQRFADPQWMARWKAADPQSKLEFTVLCAVMSPTEMAP